MVATKFDLRICCSLSHLRRSSKLDMTTDQSASPAQRHTLLRQHRGSYCLDDPSSDSPPRCMKRPKSSNTYWDWVKVRNPTHQDCCRLRCINWLAIRRTQCVSQGQSRCRVCRERSVPVVSRMCCTAGASFSWSESMSVPYGRAGGWLRFSKTRHWLAWLTA